MMSRCSFQKLEVSKHKHVVVLNVGCGEDPYELSSISNIFIVNIDLDMWKVPNFIQCDAHMLPIRDKSIDVVVLGDVLEHLVDPDKVLDEVVRVCKSNCEVIVTVPLEKEYRLGKEYKLCELAKEGFTSFEEWKLKHPVFKGRCVKPISDDLKPHTYHIHAFTESDVVNMFVKHGFKILKFLKIVELRDLITGDEIPHLLMLVVKIS